ncbi:class I SAM-dependent methyltransferase [Dyadobacter sp. OTU695]|uniref:class I SAM-dependent methyltransferase n=1 Tax=Dyadobacter sp. OTU695 TaxID=3043860 RepID=UPI00313DEEBD
MTNQEAIELIGGGADGEHAQYWLDLGCGTGTFTEALATMLPAHSKITGVDKSNQQLPPQMGNQVSIKFIEADFETKALEVPGLDGILMANSLHFIRDKESLIRRLEQHFSKGRRFLIVEYDTTSSNTWVPYPIDFKGLKSLFDRVGTYSISKLGERRSLYGSAMLYGALVASPVEPIN